MERSRGNIFRYSGRILSKDSALEGGKGMKCTFIEVKHIWGNTFGNSNVTFGQKRSGFQGQKQWQPKFHIKFKNPGPPPPYLGNIPKKKTIFGCFPTNDILLG